jgi:integrase
LQAYRERRAAEGKAAVYINMEMGAVRRVLKKGKRWHLLAGDIKPLKEHPRQARVLSYGEKLRLLKVAASRPEWQTARLAAVLVFNSSMRGCEIRGLHWRDVDLIQRTLTVRHSKTEAGERVIPLNADAWSTILELWERAKAFGGTEPGHYVFPACESGRIDPTKFQKSWRTAWRHLTREAGLRGLRFHDLRHHAITELAESHASDQTIMSIAGHVSPRMLAHYSHVRLEAKRNALDALSGGGSGVSYGTKNVTKGPSEQVPQPEVVEKSGGPGSTRTTDLTLIRGAL